MMKKYNLMISLLVILLCSQTTFAQVNPDYKSKKRAEKMRTIEEMNKPADTKGAEEKQRFVEAQKQKQVEGNSGQILEKSKKSTEDATQQKATAVEKPNPAQRVGAEETPQNETGLNSSFTQKSKAIEENKQKFEAAPKDKQLEILEKQMESTEGMTDEQKLALKIQIAELQGQDVSEMKALQNSKHSNQLDQTTTDAPATKQQVETEQPEPIRANSTQANGMGEGLVPALKGMSSTQKLEYLFRDTQFKKEVISEPQWSSLSETDKAIFAEKMYFIKNQ